MVISYFVPVPFDMGQYRCVFEDAIDGFVQLGNNPTLLGCFIGKYEWDHGLIEMIKLNHGGYHGENYVCLFQKFKTFMSYLVKIAWFLIDLLREY